MDKDVRWIVVKNAVTEAGLERYLWDTSKVFDLLDLSEEVNERAVFRALLVSAREGSGDHAAQSQADRINSSGYMTARVFETYSEARETLLED